jgi:PAS domain S-box-containing protein
MARDATKTRIHLTGWVAIVVLIVMLFGTFIAWHQIKQRLTSESKLAFDSEIIKTTESITKRIQAYTDTLQGFRGFFHSSDEVNEKEFHSYLTALNLEAQYPGFKSINFVSAVSAAQLPGFLDRIRKDTSQYAGGNPSFTVKPPGNRARYYITTYTGIPNATLPKGSDLAVDNTRRQVLEAALQRGTPIASNQLDLLGSDGKPTGKQGFWLAIPIYKDVVPETVEARNTNIEGFVTAVFDYETLFGETLTADSSALTIQIYDGQDREQKDRIYTQGTAPRQQMATREINVGDHVWTITVEASRHFGLRSSEQRIPLIILGVGFIISGLLAALFWQLSRTRARALTLADSMTVDLQQERNKAIAAQHKDEAILSSIGDGVFAIDTKGTIILFNKAAEQLSGYAAAEVLGKDYREVLHFLTEDNAALAAAFIDQALAGQRAQMARGTVLVRKDDTLLPVADSASPILDAMNVIQGAIIVFRDASDELRFQKALQESNERFELAAKATSDVVYDLHLTTGALQWNDALQSAYGYSKEESTNSLEWWTDHIHPDDALLLTKTMDKLLDPHIKNWTVEYRFRKADDSYVIVRDRAFVLRDANGGAMRLIGSMLDITQQRQLDQAKDEFVSIVSHQLRTPLTAIRLFVEMLAGGQVGELNPQQNDYIQKVKVSTDRMIKLVGDILNVSRTALGRLKIEPVPTDPNKLIQSSLEEVEPLAHEKGITCNFTAQTVPPVSLDPIIFSQVIHNFLTNAIRYSPEKSTVDVMFTQEADGYVLAVRDHGIGIPASARSRIFERFYRAENAIKVVGEGTGLGLYLIKLIMDTVGGSTWFDTEEGKGTTFYAKLPLSGMKAKQGDKSLN